MSERVRTVTGQRLLLHPNRYESTQLKQVHELGVSRSSSWTFGKQNNNLASKKREGEKKRTDWLQFPAGIASTKMLYLLFGWTQQTFLLPVVLHRWSEMAGENAGLQTLCKKLRVNISSLSGISCTVFTATKITTKGAKCVWWKCFKLFCFRDTHGNRKLR